jgi:hypothetical protein
VMIDTMRELCRQAADAAELLRQLQHASQPVRFDLNGYTS